MQCVFLYPFTEVDLRFFKGPSSLILGFAEVLTTGLNSFRNRKNAPYRKKNKKQILNTIQRIVFGLQHGTAVEITNIWASNVLIVTSKGQRNSIVISFRIKCVVIHVIIQPSKPKFRLLFCYTPTFMSKILCFIGRALFPVLNAKTFSCRFLHLRNLVPFVQFKKLEKHPWRSVTFSRLQSAVLPKVTLLHGDLLRKWHPIVQSIIYA